MNRIQFQEHVRQVIKREFAGNQRRAALAWDISEQYLCDILKKRKAPGRKLLNALNAEKVVAYRLKA